MPEERIVNRVHPTPHFQAEQAKLLGLNDALNMAIDPVVEQAAEDLLKQPGELQTGSGALQTAEAQRSGQVGQIEEDDNFCNVAPAEQTFETEKILALICDPELEKFKKQVIAAFKHLGLSTRQFFGE